MQDIDQYIDKVKHLPPAPRILPELLALLKKEDVDTERVVSLLAVDPGLTANVLQLCNSAFFGSASPAEDLQEAVMRLGFKEVFRLVAAVTGSRALNSTQKGYGIDQGELWRHSVASAVGAQLIAKRLGDDESLVFTATLLHDLGKVVLSEALEKEYDKLMQDTEDSQQALVETEKELLGFNHAEVGGRLLERWKFPDAIVGAVWYHHTPKLADPNHRLASYVYLGNMLAHFLGHGYGHHAFALRGRADALEILEINPATLPHYMIETVEQMALIEAMFRVSP